MGDEHGFQVEEDERGDAPRDRSAAKDNASPAADAPRDGIGPKGRTAR